MLRLGPSRQECLLCRIPPLNIKGESFRLKEKRKAGLLGRPQPVTEAEKEVAMA